MTAWCDNPVLREMLRVRRRSRAALSVACVPVAGVVALLGGAAAWRWCAGLPAMHPGGAGCVGEAMGPLELAVVPLGVLFWFQVTVVPFLTLPDPLRRSVRAGTAEQLLVSGLTPAAWVAGHVLALGMELFLTTCAYLPFFALPVVLGWTDAGLAGAFLISGPAMALTARLAWLLILRLPGTGAVAVLALALLGLLPALFGPEHGSRLAWVSPLPILGAGLPPSLMLYGAAAGVPDVALRVGRALSEWPGGVSWLTSFLKGHGVVWCLMIPGLLAGGIRAQRGSSGRRSSRTAGVEALMERLRDNQARTWPGFWEGLHLLGVSMVVGLLLVWWLGYAPPAGSHPGVDLLMLGAVVCLAAAVAVGACSAPGWVGTGGAFRVLLPVWLAALLRGAGMVWFAGLVGRWLSLGGRLDGPRVGVGLFLVSLLGAAAAQAVRPCRRVRAQGVVLACALAWLALAFGFAYAGQAPSPQAYLPGTVLVILVSVWSVVRRTRGERGRPAR
ncbi:MAG: hypothetical protein JXR77_10465 [Lentisphaeria bacterium]|nr:hypothetical protein [Lentisphaeria bacterium]